MDGLMAKLAAPFGINDLEFKPQTIGVSQGKPWCQIVPYIAARAVYQRLDECFGIFGWSMSVRPEKIADAEGVIATLTLIDDKGHGVTREDGSEPSDIDGYKGAISGAVKRVAVTLGIGRYLYDLDGPIYALIHEGGKHRAKGKTKRGEEYDFKWDVPPNILAQMLGVTADGEVLDQRGRGVLPFNGNPSLADGPKADIPLRSPEKITANIPRPRSVEVEKKGSIPSSCPKCGGKVYDNRPKKESGEYKKTSQDWTCADKECKTGKYRTGGWASKDESFDDIPEALKHDDGPTFGPGAEKDIPLPEEPDDDGSLPF